MRRRRIKEEKKGNAMKLLPESLANAAAHTHTISLSDFITRATAAAAEIAAKLKRL